MPAQLAAAVVNDGSPQSAGVNAAASQLSSSPAALTKRARLVGTAFGVVAVLIMLMV